MKIALCLYGNVGHKQSSGVRNLDPNVSSNFKLESSLERKNYTNPVNAADYNYFLFQKYNVDVFAHSWSVNFKNDIIDLYSPKNYEIVNQKQFDTDVKKFGIEGNSIDNWKISESANIGYKLLLPSRGNTKTIIDEMKILAFRVQSRWYSSMRSIELKREYEKKNNISYDFVVLNRYDNAFLREINFQALDKNCIYASRRDGRKDIDHALFDYWFIGGNDVMNKFGDLYKNIHEYCIRPTFSCREHIKNKIGDENLRYLMKHETDYKILR